jgi:metallo-beta-lactamase class B
MTEMHDAIASGVERLGRKVSDIRILLSSHAHFDHIEGHALMQRRTGGQVMAMTADARRSKPGTIPRRSGRSAGSRFGWRGG